MKHCITIVAALTLLVSCTGIPQTTVQTDKVPSVFPDYTNVVIPSNIAPLNFRIEEEGKKYVTVITGGADKAVIGGQKVEIPPRKWRKIKQHGLIGIQVFVMDDDSRWHSYRPFSMSVSEDEIDPYISYRVIPVAVESYQNLSIRQRNLTNFREKVIFANTMVQTNADGACINCHSYRDYSTDNMLFHVRQYKGGTVMVLDGKLHKVNMKTDHTLSAGVYPSWHPTHDYIALSNNRTHQSVHSASHDKLEVLDDISDLILYDIKNNTVSVIENDSSELENYPNWSADGRKLYYVSYRYDGNYGDKRKNEMFLSREDFHFNLYSKPFDPDTKTWGPTKLEFDAAARDSSITWPRVSPDGRWLLACISTHGVFPLDQIVSDYIMFDLENGSYRYPDELNSPFAESFHSWSSNGRWVMFSTRREDGVHTRLYFSHMDENGRFSKPFALPQRDPDFNREFLYAFNIPEFMKEPVHITPRQFASFISGTDATPAKYETKKGE
jgi:Periplasmic component of the Tol biopolymer transport system